MTPRLRYRFIRLFARRMSNVSPGIRSSLKEAFAGREKEREERLSKRQNVLNSLQCRVFLTVYRNRRRTYG